MRRLTASLPSEDMSESASSSVPLLTCSKGREGVCDEVDALLPTFSSPESTPIESDRDLEGALGDLESEGDTDLD